MKGLGFGVWGLGYQRRPDTPERDPKTLVYQNVLVCFLVSVISRRSYPRPQTPHPKPCF